MSFDSSLALKTLRRLGRTPKWLFQVWALWGMLGIILIHCVALEYFVAKNVHQWASFLTQTVGVICILISINENLKIVSEENFARCFRKWWNECPFRNKSVTVDLTGTVTICFDMKARAFGYRPNATLQEQIDYLQEQICTLQQELDREITKINESIKQQEASIHRKIDEDLNKVSSKMHAVFKGIQVPIFGAILTVYSAVIASFFLN